ncbi:DNA polymerase III delta prime subunit [Methylophaga frappieri]|uniref:DNA-directed DNA polymerase n=1 Tax=Methylophaga frappieri (strain ATCC BAA-2434 / DSM 25690 / JAM7) TaxID=754477 RepID=I1YLL5_METFJ|nr:DNA polymerase III subunit delta' [Methylophaga frappieri]AFJ03808.1 DNA polymerase III delta prime subunit [Methylophaga frappieri]
MVYPWHQPLWQDFLKLCQQQRLPHGVLLTGVPGLDLTGFANAAITYLLCHQKDKTMACGRCQSCRLMATSSHPDHQVIAPEEAGKAIKIDQIRSVHEKLALTAHISQWKTLLIAPADKMTINAANSLLKLLEEPPKDSFLILISSQPEQLPITIRSRCQHWHMASPTPDESRQWLQQNGYALSDQQWQLLARIAAYAPLQIKQMLDQNMDEHYAQVVSQYQQIRAGNDNPVHIAANWQQQDLLGILHGLYFYQHQQLMAADNSERLSIEWQLMDCIQATIKLVSSLNNYNKTLLIEDFVVRIRQLSVHDHRIRHTG